MRAVQPCGTYAAYQRHKRNGEQPCAPCKKASVIYHRNWRERTGNEAHRQLNRLKHRALLRLRNLHPDEFEELLREELLRDQPAHSP